MVGDSITFAGLPIPSSAPAFLAVLVVHVAAALTCVVAGAVAALAPKRRGRHSRAGTIYFWALAVVTISMGLLATMRWTEDRVLFAIGVAAFGAAAWARRAMRHRPSADPRVHIIGMGTSYTLLLVAFYVDNGPHLPLWRRLPPAGYWLVPSALGAIVTWRAARRSTAARSAISPRP